jgi:tRNA dimethylallyltransferase
MGYDRSLVSMQGIGYKEMFAYLDGECTLEQAVEEIKKNTRHFAKRQLTWFRREQDVRWVNYEEFAMDKNQILAYLIEECSALKALQE